MDPTSPSQPSDSALKVAHAVYALHAFAIVSGLAGTATVVGSFIGSVPSILAVVLNYVKRSEARGTWLDSHYGWQIRTFWYALAWLVAGGLIAITIVGLPISIAVFIGVTIWIIYRVARGWLSLSREEAID